MLITLVAGARPNFMKIAPIIDAITNAAAKGYDIHYQLVHTGQHYDKNMSASFFEELDIPEPDINLECGGGSQAEQTAQIMVRFEKYLSSHPCDLVIVVGDVTSSFACSIVAKKLQTKLAHVEAGIRSGDLTMPEEINRMVTDSICDMYFTTSETANQNLRQIGADEKKIFFVGNTMIDTLMKNVSRLKQPAIWNELKLSEGKYFVITLHRPPNVDEPEKLFSILDSIIGSSKGIPILFPVHPRTAKTLKGRGSIASNLHLIDALGYLEFNWLVKHAKAVITDSGGITEETTVLGIPCITLRNSTERPETITIGTNELAGTDLSALPPLINKIFDGWKKGSIPEKWDGRAAERIVDVILGLRS